MEGIANIKFSIMLFWGYVWSKNQLTNEWGVYIGINEPEQEKS